MVFSSYLFIFQFLPIALLLYYASPARLRHLVLTLLSYVFYGWANPAFLVLIAVSTLIDYVAALVIVGRTPLKAKDAPMLSGRTRSTRQRVALVMSLVSNLSLLGFFKYFNFGVDSLNAVAGALGLATPLLDTTLRIVLPLGISFYTFQSMSYTIDVYRGQVAATGNVIDFACYVSMFPQLVAGPIVRFAEIDDQLYSRTHTFEKFSRGVAMFSLGLGKKVILANPCGAMADAAFNAAGTTVADAWLGLLAYAFQIYFDFSGYSDMALGLGLMLGFVFPKNFDSPYLAESITDFWRRWHLSLSTWLRDYLYVSLGGNRRGPRRTYVNLFVVMLLGGLWHGAAWTFVIWGGVHGVLLALERWNGKRPLYHALPHAGRVATTFGIVLFTWVIFRASTLSHMGGVLATLIGLGAAPDSAPLVSALVRAPQSLVTLGLSALIVWGSPQSWDLTRELTWTKMAGVAIVFALSVALLASQAYNPFIYFIF